MPQSGSSSSLYTRGLAIVALHAIIISSLFTVYEIELPLKAAKHWLIRRISKFAIVKESIKYVKSTLGISFTQRTPTKKNKNGKLANTKKDIEPVFTPEQLALFDGSRASKPVYLALLGRVYNVEKGRKHYAGDGGYSFFAGKDATRAFVTGDFTPEGLVDDVTGLSEADLLALHDWTLFYEKEYEFVGVLEGIYYDSRGRPTEELKIVNEMIARAKEWKEQQLKESEVFPPCNSEWQKEIGGRVWCTNKSGGAKRDWVGVPRRLYPAGSSTHRCACVKNFGPPTAALSSSSSAAGNRGNLDHPNLREYDDCPETSISCRLPAE